jgi:hypothetical protein
MNRRKAIMAGFGSLFGAKAGISESLGARYNPKPPYYGGMAGTGAGIPQETSPNSISSVIERRASMTERINKLKEMLEGKYNDWQKGELVDFDYLINTKIDYDVNSLKSVSLSGKLIIRDRRLKERQIAQWRKQAQNEIDGIEKQLSTMVSDSIFGEKDESQKSNY